MKLLFDQNLSPRLPRLLQDLYPESAHIRDLGMRDVTDTQIWEYARANGFVIVEGLRLPSTQSAPRPSSQVHLAARRKLSRQHNRAAVTKPVGDDSHL